jgi:hypothetical protein
VIRKRRSLGRGPPLFVFMTEKERQEFAFRIAVRLVQLYEENQRLKLELTSRRRQGDVWRKRAQKLNMRLEGVRIYLGRDKTIEQVLEEVGFKGV